MNVLKELQSKVSGKLVKSDRNITKLSNQQKVLNSIDREIKILNERDDLVLRKITKKNNKTQTESLVDEIRMWKNHKDPKLVFVTLKFKGKILLNDGKTPLYYEVENNNKSVIEKLSELKDFIKSLDSNNKFFNQIK